MSHRYAFVLAFSLAMTCVAHADFRIDYSATGGHGDLGVLSLANGKLRAEPDRGSANFDTSSSAILDPVNADLIVLDRAQHRYTRFDGETLNQVSGLASLLGAQDLLQLKVRPSGAHEQVAGHACDVYRIDLFGEHYADYCMADASELGLSATDVAQLKRSIDMAHDLLGRIGGSFATSVFGGGRLPVKLVSYRSGKIIGISELKSVSTAKITASEVAIPGGYREQAIDPSMFAPD
jgi:hypothetical protein